MKCMEMDQKGDQNSKKEPSTNAKCSMTIHYNAESKSRAKVLYNSFRVDEEPKSVIRKLSVEDSSLIINLTSSSIANLRASSNGILENLKTLTDVIEKFEVAQNYEYSHF